MNTVASIRSPAEIYDEFFVPALFGPRGPIVARAAGVKPGDRELDVACGTGALTIAVADRVLPNGSVVGLDANPEMLAVARRKSTRIEWVEGPAEALPLPDRSFDAVVSQFGLMFFSNRPAAIREMQRVLRPGGRLAVAVWDAVENSPGYFALAELLDRLFGRHVGEAFRAPFALGNSKDLLDIARQAGVSDAEVIKQKGNVCFDSIAALVSTERACIWTLGGLLNDGEFERLRKAAEAELKPFVAASGQIVFELPALILISQHVR